MNNVSLESIFEVLDPPRGFSSWHGGPTLMGALRVVDARQAVWKPARIGTVSGSWRCILLTGIIRAGDILIRKLPKDFQGRHQIFQRFQILLIKPGKQIVF